MDGTPLSISPIDLYATLATSLATSAAPALVDVRRQRTMVDGGRLIVTAIHRAPDDVETNSV